MNQITVSYLINRQYSSLMNCCDTCIDMCKLIAVNRNGTVVHVNEKLKFIHKRKVFLFSFVLEHPLETILLRITAIIRIY